MRTTYINRDKSQKYYRVKNFKRQVAKECNLMPLHKNLGHTKQNHFHLLGKC